jgi:glycosyltransferase involved in cell wall biosynthesis
MIDRECDMLKSTVKIKAGILISTYNRRKYLKRALESAINQTNDNLEIIVIDNGSTDGTSEHMATIVDSRVRYIVNDQDIGLLGSINKGVRLFSEEVNWCTVLPDDDLLDPNFIRSMADYLQDYPAIDIVDSHRTLIDSNGRRLTETTLPPERETAIDYLKNRARFIRQTFLAGMFFNRNTYNQIGGYPQFATGMASDDALIFALAISKGLYHNRNAVAHVRMHPEAESNCLSKALKHIQSFVDFRNYVISIASRSGEFSKKDIRMIVRTLDRYVSVSISSLWVRRVHELLFGGMPSPDQELSDFYRLVGANDLPFSMRVRVDAFVANMLNWSPEMTIPMYHNLRDWLHRWTNRLKGG